MDFKSGDWALAKKEYQRIQSLALGRLEHGDIYAGSFYWLGKIAEKEGKKAEAVENYRRFLDLWKDADPDLPEVVDARTRLAGLKAPEIPFQEDAPRAWISSIRGFRPAP